MCKAIEIFVCNKKILLSCLLDSFSPNIFSEDSIFYGFYLLLFLGHVAYCDADGCVRQFQVDFKLFWILLLIMHIKKIVPSFFLSIAYS